ncbi:tubulin domain-containing protein [Bisporella sp. PMI_857]|nr:tubulin domain-containing protein [Bisporella sp. PMI_857]
MHEILTLQLGQRANYLATHFWNTQESYFTYTADQESLVDHDIHFRPGIGADGSETFTPRTLIYDLKGGFGSLRKINALYEIDEPVVPEGLWNGPAVIQRQEVIKQNAYQQSLEEGLVPPQLTPESVRYWSDFNRVYFHPKSIVQLNEYELNSSLMPFENWVTGEELFNSLDKEHDLLDRDLRPFAEEADQMQGIQLMAGVDDAWGGFAARYMDRIRDEYGKTTVWVWGLEDGITTVAREKRFLKLSNSARATSEIGPQTSLYIPITLPSTMLPSYVMLNSRSEWHSSALLSTAVEIRAESRDMRVPSQDRHAVGDSIPDEENLSVLDIDFFPTETIERGRRLTTRKPHVFGQAEAYRGEEDEEAEEANQEDEGHERARRRAAGLPVIHKSRTPLLFPVLDSFPQIFAQPPSSPGLSVKTSLSTDTTISSRIKTLQSIVRRAIGLDEREALSNALGGLAEAYEEGWDSGTDEDEDDD